MKSKVPFRITPNKKDLLALRDYYRISERYRKYLLLNAPDVYLDYIDFVKKFCPQGGTVLDLGCGTGDSTLALAKHGFRVYGVDLSLLSYFFINGDLLDLPLASRLFDVVASRAVLEHIHNPERALSEMSRVLKPDGHLIILGPNLLSPIGAIRSFWNYLIKRRKVLHPLYLNTTEAFLGIFRSFWIILCKKIERKPHFLLRTPIIISETDKGLDLDAVYLMNPVDLVNYFRQKGFKIKHITWPTSWVGKILALIAPSFGGGVGIVAQRD